MKKLYDSAKQIILNNYNGELSDVALDILSTSVMALFIKDEALSKERLPGILQKLEIHIDEDLVTDMIMKKYPQYPKNPATDSDSAMVIRALSDKEDKPKYEEWTMFISLANFYNNIPNVIAKTTHELVHLFRFNGLVENGDDVKVKDGLSIARCNIKTGKTKRKHYNLEEGYVEMYTAETLNSFFDFIKNEDVTFSPVLSDFKKEFASNYEPNYPIQRFYLERLCIDNKFKELLDESFYDTNEPTQLATYFNNVVGSSSGFTTFSRELDKLIDFAEEDNKEAFKMQMNNLFLQVSLFLNRKKY